MGSDVTLWHTQKLIAELFEKDRTVKGKHLENIFESGELNENSVCANFAHTAEDSNHTSFLCNYSSPLKKPSLKSYTEYH